MTSHALGRARQEQLTNACVEKNKKMTGMKQLGKETQPPKYVKALPAPENTEILKLVKDAVSTWHVKQLRVHRTLATGLTGT